MLARASGDVCRPPANAATLYSEKPTHLTTQTTHTPSTFHSELLIIRLLTHTNVPTLAAVLLVVRRLLRQRGRHAFIPTPPTFRWVLYALGRVCRPPAYYAATSCMWRKINARIRRNHLYPPQCSSDSSNTAVQQSAH